MVRRFAASLIVPTRPFATKVSPRPAFPADRHYHKKSEEFYFLLEGEGTMEIDGETSPVAPGDAILIPPGAWHQITASTRLRFLCCCAPPYSHDDTYFT
jgi:mannose-6-phosphate isomerase-like protein (cupin superfamily)